MTRNEIASKLAKMEAGLSSVAIGDIRQLLKLLVHLDAEQVREGGTGALHDLMNESDALVQEMIGTDQTPAKAAKKIAKKK